MGLGKSLQAIAYIKHKELRRTLVVAPASVKYSWEKELKKWTNLSYVLIDSQTDLNKIDASVEVWIINYELLKKNINTLTKVHFDCLIGDEAQYCKNLTAQRTKAFRLIARNILSVILLTGTPLLSRPVELYTLLNIIDPLTWNNYYEYVRRYCNAHQTRYGLDVSGVSNIEELSTRIQRYYIRRKKSDVLTDLPEKIHIPFPVQLEKQKAQEYDKAEENFAEYLIEHSGKQPAEVAKTLQAEKLARLNVLRQLCSQGKLPAAYELIDSILESREKILIFSSFVAPLEELHTHYGDKAVILTGKTEMGERGKIVERFQTDSDVKILLGGFKSAGVGLTLTAATAVIALDLPWNPADMQQAIDRAHRIGQTGSVSVYYITARGTIDDKLQEILDRKQKIFDKLIDGTTDDNTNSGKDINETINTILAKHIKSHARKNFEVHEGKV